MRVNLLLASTLLASAGADPTVTLPHGGKLKGVKNVNFDEYHNVPFAAPPVGSLRWKSPKPPASWKGTIDASQWGNSCMQFDANAEFPGNFPLYQDLPIIYPDTKKAPYSEDCLNLNVFVPHGGSSKKPVMLFLHGGGLIFGSASAPVMDGSYLAASQKDVIIVTANYRLGIFGYLGSTELKEDNTADDSTGNFGFLDQRRALEWIQDNISSFGGDPKQVTLMGQSAGAQSALWHLIYTNEAAKSSGRKLPLFNKVVMTSPNPPLKPYLLTSAQLQFNNLVNSFNCTSTSPKTKISCLRSQSSTALNTYQKNLWTTSYRRNGAGPFAMVVDNAVIPTPGWERLKNGQYDKTVKIIIGDDADEGTGFIRQDSENGDTFATLDAFISNRFGWIPQEWREKIVPLYTSTYPKLQDQKTRVYGDLLFNCPNRLLARKFASTNPSTYYYLFSVDTAASNSTVLKGSPHASELISFFRYLPAMERKDEIQTAWRMGEALTNFVNTGNPDEDGDGGDVRDFVKWGLGLKNGKWPAFKKAGGAVVEFGNEVKVVTDANRFCDLFDKVYETLL